MGNQVAKAMPPPSPSAVSDMSAQNITETTLRPDDSRIAVGAPEASPSNATPSVPSASAPSVASQAAPSAKHQVSTPASAVDSAPPQKSVSTPSVSVDDVSAASTKESVASIAAPVAPKAHEPVATKSHEPVVQKDIKPVVEKEAKPAAAKVQEPVVEKVQEPVVEKASKPDLKVVAEPVVEKLPKPTVDSVAAPSVGQSASAASTDDTPRTREESTVGELPPTPDENAPYSPFGTPVHVFATPEAGLAYNAAAAVTTFSIAGEKRRYDGPDDVHALVAHLSAHASTLRTVVLSGNSFGADAVAAVASAIAHGMPALEELDASDMFTGRLKSDVPRAMASLADAVAAGALGLRRLDVSDNAFGPAGAEAVARMLAATPSLESFVSNNNGYGPAGGALVARALLGIAEAQSAALKGASSAKDSSLLSSPDVPRLRRVEIGRNRLENGAAPDIARALAALGALEQLALPQNGIRPEGIAALAGALAANPSLRVLNLKDNTFAHAGGQGIPSVSAFADVLRTLTALRVLDIGDTYLTAEGCTAIIAALPPGLEELNMTYNDMDDAALTALAGRVREMSALRSLALNGNTFDPEGDAARAVRAAVASADVLDEWSDMDGGDSDEDLAEDVDKLNI